VGRLARGLDERPVVPDHEAKSVGNEVTFPEDIGDAVELHDVLDQLSHQVARRLRQCGKRCRTVQLKARFPDFSTYTRAETLPSPTDSTRVLRDTARHLLDVHLDRRGRPLRLVGVSAQNLVAGEDSAPLLFPDPDAERDRELDQIMDRAADRFGKGALTRGLQRRKPGSREGFE
jgi:DNA polymerase-4